MKNSKKGFTIVELVIVIAVIAILAAVLIPTFSGIIDNANKSAAEQEARNAYTQYVANHAEEGFDAQVQVTVDDKYIVFIDSGAVKASIKTNETVPDEYKAYKAWTVKELLATSDNA